MDINALIQWRENKDEFFRLHPQSPLSEAQKAAFDGLSYFDPNPDLDLIVQARLFTEREDVKLETTKDRGRWMRRYGEFTFEVGEKQARLTLYQTGDDFFLLFSDGLAGAETYAAGRYLEPISLGDDRFHIDFNKAYNPFCVYSYLYDCPITPPENRLSVPIRAGERLPLSDWIKLSDE